MMLCASVKEPCFESIELANKHADLIEFRLDLFMPKDLFALTQACQKPVIFKLKSWDPKILDFSPSYIDLPYDVPPAVFKTIPSSISRICSYHDEQKTPDLLMLYEKMQKCPAEYYKIATLANSTLDALKMLAFVRDKKCIGICMGERGEVTRILAPVFGAPWTYAALGEEQKTAPGQLLLQELISTYRYPFLSKKTDLYGLIGDPISQSVSHKTHNMAFDQLGLDAVYVKMQVQKGELSSFLPLCQRLGFKGLSVTMPLKEAIKAGKAVNTIGFFGKKMLTWNTDGSGALNALEKKGKVAGKRLVILGAGGTARAVAKEAKKRGAKVIIANRTELKARRLAALIGCKVLPIKNFASKGYDILINCTPTCPISFNDLLENRLVMDVVSQPEMTPLLKAAQSKGCELVFGMDMFIQQAIGQYCHWLKVD